MSESFDVQRLILSGLLGSWFALGGGTGEGVALAGGLHRSAAAVAMADVLTAQASEPALDAAASQQPADGESEPAGDEVAPFSELNEALSTARSRLTELTKAAEIAKVAGELRENLQHVEAENRQLKSALSELQTDNDNLLIVKQVADRRLVELEQEAGEAASEALSFEEELVSVRRQNSQLSTNLTRAETTSRETTEELAKVRNELGSRTEALTIAAEESASEIAQLQRELDGAGERRLIAERDQAARDAELVELRKIAEDTGQDNARLATDLDSTITDLAKTQTELTTTLESLDDSRISLDAAEQETTVLRTQLTGNRSETDELQDELETAEVNLDKMLTLNAALEQQVEVLKTAAGEATNAARQNLLAVENQINEINAALASVKADELLPAASGPAGGPADTDDGVEPAVVSALRGDDGWVPRPSPPRSTVEPQLIAAAAVDSAAAPATPQPRPPATSPASVNLAALLPESPAGQRRSAETLIGALGARSDDRGLTMTVPGALLFAVNGEEIEPSAHEALSNVAELVDIYDERDVLIIGHTDAVGDATYNQQLSERRAALVKSFFIDKFGIASERLKIEGLGEQDPISSNATADGRNANRRVEVVILN